MNHGRGRSPTPALNLLPPVTSLEQHDAVLGRVGLAVAEFYQLLPESLAGTGQPDGIPDNGLVREQGQWLREAYGEVIPDRWLDCSADPAVLSRADVEAIAHLIQGYAASSTPDALLLGQVHETLTPDLETVSGRCTASRRKRQGTYYTPPELALDMVRWAVRPGACLNVEFAHDDPPPVRVLDPACGGGIFLLMAYRHLLEGQTQRLGRALTASERRRLLENSIFGVDLDPCAVAVTQTTLRLEVLRRDRPPSSHRLDAPRHLPCPDLSRTIRQGNAIVPEGDRPSIWTEAFPDILAEGGFDSVIGNPPYVDSELMVAAFPDWRHYCTRHYQAAQGNWDLFCVFIEQALKLCKPGGYHSFVVPNKLASAPYAAAVRSLLTEQSQLKFIRDYSASPVFPVAVYPLVYGVQKRSPQPSTQLHRQEDPAAVRYESMGRDHRVSHTSFLPASQFTPAHRGWRLSADVNRSELVQQLCDRFPSLGELATVTGAATVAEAYGLKPLIQDLGRDQGGTNSTPQSRLRLINSGTIDPYAILWGQKPLRYLGDLYDRPVIAPTALKALFPKRYVQATTPKLIIAGMTRRLECVIDASGQILAGKSTSIIQLNSGAKCPVPHLSLLALLGILNSQLMTLMVRHLFSGNRLQGGYLRLGPPQLRQLPVPPLDSVTGDRLETLVRLRLLPQEQIKPQRKDDVFLPMSQPFPTAGIAQSREISAVQTPLPIDPLPEALSLDDLDWAIEEAVCAAYGLSSGAIAHLLYGARSD